jgi:hypothetical protein
MCDKHYVRSKVGDGSLEGSDPFCPDRGLPVSLYHAETERIGALPVRLPMVWAGVEETGEQKGTNGHGQRLFPVGAS